jgi:glycosyltransferase involved in cell wall biosynthesis
MPQLPPWDIVTGEYPLATGGVAGYSRQVACGLADMGDEVHVWAPSRVEGLAADPGVHVHALPHGFGMRGLLSLAKTFRRMRRPRRVLLQYVPDAFGLKGMNLPFCRWVTNLPKAELWVMFHEVAVPWAPWQSWKQNVVSLATRRMASTLVMRADRVLVSVPIWVDVLHLVAPRWRGVASWSPVPSNVATEVTPAATVEVRARLNLPAEGLVIGHFGTYGPLIAPLLKPVLGRLLQEDSRRYALLIGGASEGFARDVASSFDVAGRVVATGYLSKTAVAAHLCACDLLVQPYADGVSARRTSAMAALALGLPVVTNEGVATEPVWKESGAVALAASPQGLVDAVEALASDKIRASILGSRARELYERQFSISRTIAALRERPSEIIESS